MSIHPRFQRAFFAWLDRARPRLDRELRVTKRTNEVVEFEFDVGAPALLGWLDRNELAVGVYGEGENWDLILDLDAYGHRSRFCRFEVRPNSALVCNRSSIAGVETDRG